MTHTDPLRLALVGLGRMGRFHLRALRQVEDIDVVAIAEPSQTSLEAAGADVGAAQVVTEIGELPAHPDVEAWLIASPTPTHPGLTEAALDAGIHVLCEKPLALEPDEGVALGERARRSGLVLQVGFWRRFSPPWRRARDLIVEGAIGDPVLLRLSQWDADPPPPEFCDPAVSGGLAIDCGVHEFDLAEWLTGMPVERVSGHHLPIVDDAVGASGDVDNLLAILHLSGGPVATVDLSRTCRYGDDVRTEILGSQGALFVDLLSTGRTRIATADGVRVVPGSEVDDATEAGVVGQARAFAAAVRGGAIDVPGATASARSVVIGRAVDRSATTGAEVDVPRPM